MLNPKPGKTLRILKTPPKGGPFSPQKTWGSDGGRENHPLKRGGGVPFTREKTG